MFPDAEGSHRRLLLAQLHSNPVQAWVNSYGVRSIPQEQGEIGITVSYKEIMQCIHDFCIDNDAEVPSSQKIGRSLSDLRFDKKRGNDGMVYKLYGVTMGELLDPFIIRNERFIFNEEIAKYLEEKD